MNISRHWQGKADVWPLLLIHIGAVTAILVWAVGRSGGLADPLFPVLAGLVCAVTLWQVVGTIRAARDVLGEPDGLFVSIFLGFATMVSFGLVTVTLLGATAARNLDPELSSYIPPPVRASLSPDGAEMFLTGVLDYELLAQFDAKKSASLKTLVLNSDGGRIFAARTLATKVTKMGLNTQVSGDCFSACTLVFMAGVERRLGPTGRLGFHGYKRSGPTHTAIPSIVEEEEKDRRFFQNRGVAQAFLQRAYATDHSDIWIPTRAELRRAGILTH